MKQPTIEELSRDISIVERCKVAFEDALELLGTTNTIHDARTIIALTLVNLRNQRVLAISGEAAANDIAQELVNDRFDIAEEQREERRQQQREEAGRRQEDREYYRGWHNR